MKQHFRKQAIALPSIDFNDPHNLFGVLAIHALTQRNLAERAAAEDTTPEERKALLQQIQEGAEATAAFTLTLDKLVRAQHENEITDKLTGLHNVAYFDPAMQAAIDSARFNKEPLSVLAFDIDRFKSVNDTYGHLAGDRVLQIFAQQIKKAVRSTDIVARVGGEEFMVVLPNTTKAEALEIAEALRLNVASRSAEKEKDLMIPAVTTSIGLAMLGATDDPKTLRKRADEALYKAKQTGRNRVVSSDLPAQSKPKHRASTGKAFRQ